MSNVTVIALSDFRDNQGVAPPTMDKLSSITKRRNITFFGVQVEHAYVVDSDLLGKEITIHNFDGKETKINIPKADTVCIVRGGAMQTPSSKALVSSLQEAGLFMVNTLEATTDSSNKFTGVSKLPKPPK